MTLSCPGRMPGIWLWRRSCHAKARLRRLHPCCVELLATSRPEVPLGAVAPADGDGRAPDGQAHRSTVRAGSAWRSDASCQATADIGEEHPNLLQRAGAGPAIGFSVDRRTSDPCSAASVMHWFKLAALDEEADSRHRHSEVLRCVELAHPLVVSDGRHGSTDGTWVASVLPLDRLLMSTALHAVSFAGQAAPTCPVDLAHFQRCAVS